MSTLQYRREAARRRASLRLAWIYLSALIAEWRRRARSRAALAQLSPNMLRDIGLSPADRFGECRKMFWQR